VSLIVLSASVFINFRSPFPSLWCCYITQQDKAFSSPERFSSVDLLRSRLPRKVHLNKNLEVVAPVVCCLSVAADSQFSGRYISCVPAPSWLAIQASSEEPCCRSPSTNYSERWWVALVLSSFWVRWLVVIKSNAIDVPSSFDCLLSQSISVILYIPKLNS